MHSLQMNIKPKIGDIVLIEILKKERYATLLYIDEYHQKVGIKLLDPIFAGFGSNQQDTNIPHSKMDQDLIIGMHRIKRIISPTDLLRQLTAYKYEIKKAQQQQTYLLSLLSTQSNHKQHVIKNINKECVVKGLSVKIKENKNKNENASGNEHPSVYHDYIQDIIIDDADVDEYDDYDDDEDDKTDDDEQHERDDQEPANPMLISNNIDDYHILQTLGVGGCAKVKLAENKFTEQCFAMKVFKRSELVESQQRAHIQWEQSLLSDMTHSFIIRLLEHFETDTHLYWLMDFIHGGDLFLLIRENKRLSLSATQFYAAQIAFTFKYLHGEKSVIFRDLKPENVLIDKYGYIKLCDFGIAKQLVSDQKHTDDQQVDEQQTEERDDGKKAELDEPICYTLCGTPEYLSPELIVGRGYSFSADWWAFGVLCYEMLCGKTPFNNSDKSINIYNLILTEKVFFRHELGIHIEAQKFIKSLLKKDPSQRMRDPDFIMNHAFFASIHWHNLIHKSYKEKDIPFIPNILSDKDTRYFDEYDDDDEDDEHADDLLQDYEY